MINLLPKEKETVLSNKMINTKKRNQLFFLFFLLFNFLRRSPLLIGTIRRG
jgi:hypothetical protein